MVLAVLASAVAVACNSNDTSKTAAGPTTTSTFGAATTSTVAATTTTVCGFSGDEKLKTSTASGGTMLLTAVRADGHGCFDRVVLEFRPQQGSTGAPAYGVEYENPPFHEDASGRTIVVKGNAFLSVRLEPASGADLSNGGRATYTGPASVTPGPGATRVQEVRRTGDFEAVLHWVIGLDQKRLFTVTVLSAPIRVVIDIG
jgi:hypothetical protein